MNNDILSTYIDWNSVHYAAKCHITENLQYSPDDGLDRPSGHPELSRIVNPNL